ncbi:MAG: lysophospholipid acyltransferase family protein [Polyangia bacterium]
MYVVGLPVFLLTAVFDPLRVIGHRYATYWGRMMFYLNSRWSCRVVHPERVPSNRAFVVVSNHEGVADIMVTYHLDLHFKWISKASNFFVPFMGWFMFHAGYIPLRRGRRDSVRTAMGRARDYLERGVSVLFFAEGTRSLDGIVKPFKPGAFRLAIEGQFDILPIAIAGSANAIPKHSWKFSEERTPMKLVVGEIISTKGLTESDLDALVERSRNVVIELKAEGDAMIDRELGRSAPQHASRPVPAT